VSILTFIAYWCHNPEDHDLNLRLHGNLTSHILPIVLGVVKG